MEEETTSGIKIVAISKKIKRRVPIQVKNSELHFQLDFRWYQSVSAFLFCTVVFRFLFELDFNLQLFVFVMVALAMSLLIGSCALGFPFFLVLTGNIEFVL